MSSASIQAPPDQAARVAALDPCQSILVQAPAGSGKTDLLTRRFLRLLAEVEDPGRIVAITFTKAAAAEMRHRILSELENASRRAAPADAFDAFSMEALAQRALDHSRALDWKLLDLTSQLRISTIDSFCRDLALQQPLLAGIGGNLQINEQPNELYRRAARRALENLGNSGYPDLSDSIESLLLWRDNGWREMEKLLEGMLAQRDRWMLGFVLDRDQDWDALRARLEHPFRRAVENHLTRLNDLFAEIPGAREEITELAREACEEPGLKSPLALAESLSLPQSPFADGLEDALEIFKSLARFLQTSTGGKWRSEKGLTAEHGFPSTPRGQAAKAQFASLITRLETIPELERTLHDLRLLPSVRYSDEEWKIVRACFTLLRRSVAELKTIFAETGTVDFVEVAQIAQQVLQGADGYPTDSALAVADGIHHILIDEFQDTSRRQYQLLCSLVAAWPDPSGRTVFVVGDPMQSIYFFRDADAELFPRVREQGLRDLVNDPVLLNPVDLKANFRTEKTLVNELNQFFGNVFAIQDGSGVRFSSTDPARDPSEKPGSRLHVHLRFVLQAVRTQPDNPAAKQLKQQVAHEREDARELQTAEIVELIRNYQGEIERAQAAGRKFRIAVLGRTRNVLAPIALALREARIPFRALELERLKDRPEILDVISLARALMNPEDRVAWLGVLRAPWCGLSLSELHAIAGNGAGNTLSAPIPSLLIERMHLLSVDSQRAIKRLLHAFESLPQFRRHLPAASLGTSLEYVWIELGGNVCVDQAACANLDLLWKLLDGLPDGEQDLIGPALGNALESLCALPDPAVSDDYGVQLMTIHKSKGLEFEVVIVPDLQASTQMGERKLLSWLERGLAASDDSSDITEFLVAPVQPKGAVQSPTRSWVNRMYRDRESQEMRRILYVVATRAREELHLFARPEFKQKDGFLDLIDPSKSLFATAWPALKDEVRARFDAWLDTLAVSTPPEETIIPEIAAGATDNVLVMPAPPKPTFLRRLPPEFQLTSNLESSTTPREPEIVGSAPEISYERHQGGMVSRALGNAVHKLLEKLAKFRATSDWKTSLHALADLRPAILAQIRAVGIPSNQAGSIAERAYEYVNRAAEDPYGQWILSPHAEAASEASWAGSIAGNLRIVRVDRIFRAGLEPLHEGTDAWWIIDFKTANADDVLPLVALPEFRAAFAPQLQMYAAVLRNLHGSGTKLRAGLYYPRMSMLDWWDI